MSEQEYASGNPCLQCGACCATYRVSFYWAEAAERGLPESLTGKASPWHACMAGTEKTEPRCHALIGTIGKAVSCAVYAQRPTPCREVLPRSEKCHRARLRHGLEPRDGGS